MIAGCGVPSVINELAATTLTHGIDKPSGGTCYIHTLKLQSSIFEVKLTDGNTHLGSEDLYIVLAKHILTKFKKDVSVSISGDIMAVQCIHRLQRRLRLSLIPPLRPRSICHPLALMLLAPNTPTLSFSTPSLSPLSIPYSAHHQPL